MHANIDPLTLRSGALRSTGKSMAVDVASARGHVPGGSPDEHASSPDRSKITSAQARFGRLLQDIHTAQTILAEGADPHARDRAELSARQRAARAGWSEHRLHKTFLKYRRRSHLKRPGNPFLPEVRDRRVLEGVRPECLEAGADQVLRVADWCAAERIRDVPAVARQIQVSIREHAVRRDGLVERARAVLRARTEHERDRIAWLKVARRAGKARARV